MRRIRGMRISVKQGDSREVDLNYANIEAGRLVSRPTVPCSVILHAGNLSNDTIGNALFG